MSSDWQAMADVEAELESIITESLDQAIEAALERFGNDYAFDYLAGSIRQARTLWLQHNPQPKQKPEREKIPFELRQRIYERDAYRCVECGDWHDLTLDHINPVVRGGASTFENLQTLCKSCNSRKGAQ